MENDKTVSETSVDAGNVKEGSDGVEEPIALSKAELDKLIQAETDRRISQAHDTIRSKVKSDLEKEYQAKQREVEKQSLIEQHKYKELSELKQSELDSLKAEISHKEKIAVVTQKLSEKNMGEYAKFFIADSSPLEQVLERIEEFEKINTSKIQSKVENTVKEKLNNSPPNQQTETNSVKNWWDLPKEQYDAYKKANGIYTL